MSVSLFLLEGSFTSEHAGKNGTLNEVVYVQALAAIPLLLIAPVLGFTARCVVDYIHAHIEQEVGKRFAEMESWQARRRPRVKRWQTILDEDRDEDELEPLTTSAISEYQYQASFYTSKILSLFNILCGSLS